MAYNPADFELVEAPASSAPPYNPADFELVEAPQGSGFWRQSLDLPVSALGGVVSGLKGMSDVFGANNPVSQELASYQQFYNQSLSPEAQADQQEVARIMQEAQDKGVWEQIKAGGRAFAVAPLDTAAQSLGTMAPVVATGLAGRAFGLGAKGVQVAQAAAGSSIQMGTVKDEIYQNTKQFLMQQGKSEEDADKVALEAQSYGGQNLDQLLLAAGLGAADALLGAERILGGAISKTGKEVTGGVIANALKTGVSEAIPEALQGGQEPLAKNVALQREGFAVPTMRGVVAQGTMEGLAGFAAGAPAGAAEGIPSGYDVEKPVITVDPQPASFTPPPSAEPVVISETFGDPTTAAAETEAAQPPPSYNPDDFEVVEEPSAPIVTEPPAAPIFQFNLADDTATAPEVDAGANVFSGVQQQQPSGPPEFSPEVPSRVQKLKAKLAEADPLFADPDFWKAGDQRGYDEVAIANLEKMLKNFSKSNQAKPSKAKVAEANPVADIWEKYDSTGEIDSVGSLADEIEAFLVNSDNPQLEDAVREYRASARIDFEEYAGRGEDGYTDRFVAAVQQAAQRSRRRIKNMTAQSGAIDLSIVDDLVEYGKTVYRAGMDYATWAAAMVNEFGQAVASYLRDAFDRIVAAYRNSVFADETGAVGGRRPVRFKRSVAQLEELAKDSEAFKTWFEDFRKYLETDFLSQFPEYAPLVNEFLSATSAATSVSANVPIMVKQLKHFLETGEIKTTFVAHANNLQRAISGQKLEGPKISEYSDAVFGNPNAIPVDRHIAQIMFGVKAPSDRQIEAAKRRIREIAARLNWEPRQVMAALWAANQKLNNQPSESYERHLERFKGELLSILSKDRSGEGRGLQASRRIADRISAAGRAEGGSSDGARAAKARISAKITSQSGAIDLSIVEDLVQYGQTIYRAGMSFGKWAGEMVKEFGQGIASFLRQAFDRIVQAYKDSPYSDTTGAVGDVRPKAKPRQFEQKAAQAPGISEEARAQMGNDPYVPITLRGVAEQAKAWIAENGVEAAERRILELADEGQTPTPLDFAIGLELTANLSATGNAARAASVVRTMSRRATSLGQTISTLAMLSRLTPEGIVFYANQIIEQHISSLSPERQAEIRAAQQDVVNLEETVATTRKRTAEDAIINGTQGGEKIQEKLKRRIPDKTQKQRTNVSIRSVLTSQATKAEATKQITQILVDSGISQSEATALATAITSRFYKVMEDARKALANSRKPAGGKGRITFDKLIAKLKDGQISDQEFIATLGQLVGVPGLTPELRATLEKLTREYKSATDDDIALVLAARIFEEVHGLVPADLWVKLRAGSYLSMLFSPRTWIRNLGGNQIQWLTDIGIDSAISMVFDPIASIFTGKRTTAGVYVGTRIKALLTPVQDVIRGYKWNAKQNPSANVMENMAAGLEHLRVLAKLTTQNKFDIVDAKEVGRRIFSNKFMQMWEGALSIALGGGDRAFWMSAFRASLARREAAAKKNGTWTGQPTPEDVDAAYADAMYAIYQNPNVLSKNSNKIRQALNRLSTFGKTDQFGVGTGLLAFTQVPGSLSLRGLIEMSPLGLVTALYEGVRPVLFKASGGRVGGSFRQEDFNKALSRAMVGSGMFYAGGYWLYSMGIITASREDDDDLEAMRRASGMGAYRINVSALKRMLGSGNFYQRQTAQDGDLIVSYDWAQPVAITFAAGAELAKMVEENDRNGIKRGLAGKVGMAAISLAAGAKSLEELPLLSGLSSFMKTWGYSGPLDAVVNTVSGMPSMFVPQLVRQANQLMDNTVRETRGDEGMMRAFNRIAANTPGVSDQFPPRMDIMGQAIERYQYAGNTVFNVLINPTMTSRVKSNPALQEVARLMQTTGETSQVPRQVTRSVAINGENVNLSNEQISAYQYYLGNYTMSIFNWRMASPQYARLPDTEKVRLLAQDLEDVNAATKSALFGHDINRLTRRQRVMRNNLVNSPLGQSMPPR